MQLSNFPDVQPARRLLAIGSLIFAALFALNILAAVMAFIHHDTDRWLNLVRLFGNLVVAVLLYRGYVLLAMLAERASLYKRAIEYDMPRLMALAEQRSLEPNEVAAPSGAQEADQVPHQTAERAPRGT